MNPAASLDFTLHGFSAAQSALQSAVHGPVPSAVLASTDPAALALSQQPDASGVVIAVGAALIAVFSTAALVVVRARRA